ncbi:hypothetical protein EMPS_02718 [Entomortierella parvispora]|uniref:Uncharacterized protein n=1 Tax=Entomortierella parvispora TaxID=205924 RepID=A0A9P3H5F3_9FUNG|nr:hypothetical protein EMPS_02718 [Entomortierella parvispora]
MLSVFKHLATLSVAVAVCATSARASLDIVGPGNGNVWVVGLPAIIVWKFNSPLKADDTMVISIVDITSPKTVTILDKKAILGLEYIPLLAVPEVDCGSNCVLELSATSTTGGAPTVARSEVFTILKK